jgi:ribulose-5-phosphate 4-epimerase/fuculose-1-phosphate aldolase
MKKEWTGIEQIFPLFHALGRASLVADMQDSHSGNLAMRIQDDKGRERMAITATGSQKGDLEPEQICMPGIKDADFGYYKASSETDIHAAILSLPGVNASMHAHTKELTIATMDDADKPNQPGDFIPVDLLGHYFLKGRVKVEWFAVPSGSPEIAERIPARLADHPLAFVQGHGAFAKGRSLKEAFFMLCVANNSGYIVNTMRRMKIDVEALRNEIMESPESHFSYAPGEYAVEGDERCDFPEEDQMIREFYRAGVRIFEQKLSPFHTGSISVRGVRTMFYAPKASMPLDLQGPLLEVPLAREQAEDPELAIHRAIYAESNFQTVMHCYLPEAEALAYFRNPGESEFTSRIIPIDAEGSFLYLVIPVLPPQFEMDKFIRCLHDYKMVVVRGGGTWAVGAQSISEVLHHPSSLREICLYRVGAFERGLDIQKMEPKKAKKW